ncbi:MAG: N-acetylmuramoyl-L-alanine amidase [Fibrobacteraceae bacterium]|nr:N-acetylmuramoyl-L-alanine amidase [Fibrobacteraceae bacterium]
MEEIAKKVNASFHWFPVQKIFYIASPKDTAKFAIGMDYVWLSKNEAGVGGTEALNLAPTLQGDKICISKKDAALFQKWLPQPPPQPSQPVPVAKPKNETAGTREVKTIVIDPGHGGKDSGALGKKSQEKDIVLAVAKLLKKELEKEDFKVKLTRDKDVFIELGERANLANQWDGDLFLSLHCNAIDGAENQKRIKGYHFYVLRAPESEEDKAIARRENKVAALYGEKNAKEELSPIEWFKLEARLEKYKQNSYMLTENLLKSFDGGKIKKLSTGVGGAGFMVLVGAMMPAVLVELGYITHPEDEDYMITTKGQEDLAKRVAKAVEAYKEGVKAYRETLGR